MTEIELRTVWNVVRNRLPYASVRDQQMRTDRIIEDLDTYRKFVLGKESDEWFLSKHIVRTGIIEMWQRMRFNNFDIIKLMSLG